MRDGGPVVLGEGDADFEKFFEFRSLINSKLEQLREELEILIRDKYENLKMLCFNCSFLINGNLTGPRKEYEY